MDIYCSTCGEPWEMDSLHDMPEGSPYKTPYDPVKHENPGYQKAAALFRQYGCGFFEHAWNGGPLANCTRPRSKSADTIAAIMDINGEDMDGAAADFEDAELLGLL